MNPHNSGKAPVTPEKQHNDRNAPRKRRGRTQTSPNTANDPRGNDAHNSTPLSGKRPSFAPRAPHSRGSTHQSSNEVSASTSKETLQVSRASAPVSALEDSSRDGSRKSDKDRSGRPSKESGSSKPSTPVTRWSQNMNHLPGGVKYFKSRRIKKGEIEKPWLKKNDPREIWSDIIVIVGMILSVAVTGVLIWDGLRRVPNHKYCPVLIEDFSSWNDNVWSKEVEVGGFGNGQFEMTTDSSENVYIQNGVLVIQPTLQDEELVENNHIIDLRGHGCTGSRWSDCVASTNTTNGTIVNPVKSARISTRLGAFIRYGRIEVTAKLPEGDWLWPAIWMLPRSNVYGEWPKSGEIDIAEGRGNDYTYDQGGNDIVSSALHFGPNTANDGWWKNNAKRQALHTTFSSKWHTFGVEWSEKYIYTYIDSRMLQTMYTQFDEPFWEYGQFPLSDSNGTRLQNPWGDTESNTSPFDQDFYLILDVAVGGTNGWFEDGKSGKPWLDRSPMARKDFWQARDEWYPTWQKHGFMEVKSVKMWQQQGYNGCLQGSKLPH